MEILPSHIRAVPLPESRADLAALLRGGRVVSATIAELRGTQAILAIGGQRLGAEVPPGLSEGQQLLLRARQAANGAVSLGIVGGGEADEPGLVRLLRSVVGLDRPVGELLASLARTLRGSRDEGGQALLGRVLAHAFRPDGGGTPAELGQALRQALESSGLRYEAALARMLGGGGQGDARALLADLKAELLADLDKRAAGPLREAVARALAGIEAEQLLNAARREDGEPFVWSLPLHDGREWTTAHLRWHREPPPEDDPEDGATLRVSLGVSFSRTGPVHVDAWLRDDGALVRISVERDEVAKRIRDGFDGLLERLASDRRPVQLVVGVVPSGTFDDDARVTDIGFLREHPLMDVSG